MVHAQRRQFGIPRVLSSDDAKSELRGALVTLRNDLRSAQGRTGDRATNLHIAGAIKRIDEILDPKKQHARMNGRRAPAWCRGPSADAVPRGDVRQESTDDRR